MAADGDEYMRGYATPCPSPGMGIHPHTHRAESMCVAKHGGTGIISTRLLELQ